MNRHPPTRRATGLDAFAGAAAAAAALAVAGCPGPEDPADPGDPVELAFPEGFRWGAASAAHQIEGGNDNNQWWQFETLPAYAGMTAEPSGDATRGYALYETDADLAAELGVDLVRVSIEWSRVEPSRDVRDSAEIDHYRAVLEALRARGIEPMVTLHHFTDPVWTHDLRDPDCEDGPSDSNLCGWTNPETAEEFAEFAAEMAALYGDLVDEWTTFNEPMAYVIAGHVAGVFPPGETNLLAEDIVANVLPVMYGMLDAHAAAYAAVRAVDAIDADGDGTAVRVGFTNAISHIGPVDPSNPDDVAAAERVQALYGFSFPDGAILGLADSDLDGVPTESHPEWAGTCDLLGFQYYTRMPVRSFPGLPPFDALPCDPLVLDTLGLDADTVGCPQVHPDDLTQMGYEHYPPGIRLVGEALAARYPGVPMRVTENGIATTTGQRRAESVVRHLEEVHALVQSGAPVDGYVHWSLTDNFEWAEGFRPRFGLYTVDYQTYARTPSLGAEVYARIVAEGGIAKSLREAYGGDAPLSPGE